MAEKAMTLEEMARKGAGILAALKLPQNDAKRAALQTEYDDLCKRMDAAWGLADIEMEEWPATKVEAARGGVEGLVRLTLKAGDGHVYLSPGWPSRLCHRYLAKGVA